MNQREVFALADAGLAFDAIGRAPALSIVLVHRRPEPGAEVGDPARWLEAIRPTRAGSP